MKSPIIFLGHGSPMNILEDNNWTKEWKDLGQSLKNIRGILMVSAHWYTEKTYLTKEEFPKMIYDMYGFPDELYEFVYPAKNQLDIRDEIKDQLEGLGDLNDQWGYDHGGYSVLHHLFPEADLPVLQLSINGREDGLYHYKLGQALKDLRNRGILIIGSGNIVHNLRILDPRIKYYDWAKEFDDLVLKLVEAEEFLELAEIEEKEERLFALAAPTPDHFYPFLVALGGVEKGESLKVINKDLMAGSLSMTSYIWGLEED